jgi:hypothetical protein
MEMQYAHGGTKATDGTLSRIKAGEGELRVFTALLAYAGAIFALTFASYVLLLGRRDANAPGNN